MPDKPVTHGWDHRPGGLDPTLPGYWHYVASSGSAWSSSTTYNPGDVVSHDVFLYTCMVSNTNREPNVSPIWAHYWMIDVPLFQNSWVNVGGSSVPMRFRITVGPPNTISIDNGAIITYSDHEVELEGDIKGGSDGTTVFWLPPAYRKQYDIPVHAHDDSGLYIAGRLYSAGNLVIGTA